MEAETLNCPMCGASASTDATSCGHCGARLATVACPSCFGMMFVGAKFCSHCGARADRHETPDGKVERCPRCRVGMEAVTVGVSTLRECPRCEGLWVDGPTLQQICIDREQQAAILGVAQSLESMAGRLEKVHYVPCPICGALMNRVNFARCSQVVVDVCNKHGTWFDREELRRVVAFIRGGGLDQARLKEMVQLEEERRRINSQQRAGQPKPAGLSDTAPSSGWTYWEDIGLGAIASVLKGFFK